MSYLRYLCLFVHSGVQHILCCVCLCIVVSNTYCVVFCLSYFVLRMLPVSLDCPFVIAPLSFPYVAMMISFFIINDVPPPKGQ